MNPDTIRKSVVWFLVFAITIILMITVFAGFIIDYLWFSSLQYAGVFWTVFSTKFWYFLLFTLGGLLILFSNLWLTRRFSGNEWRLSQVTALKSFEFGEYTEPLKQFTGGGARQIYLLSFLVAAAIAIITGLTMAPHWEKFLQYFNSVPFGKSDPIFGHDIGFYVFAVPVYTLVQGWLFSLMIVSLLICGVIYWMSGMFQISGRTVSFANKVKTHLYTLVALGLLLKVWDYRLQMYDLLYSRQGLVFGGGYTEYEVQLVALWVLLLYMLALAVFTVSGIFSAKNRIIALVVALILALPIAFVLEGVLPGTVQQLIVKPNELIKEEPFIKNNIAMTNAAYGLTDIAVKPFSAEDTLTLDDVKQNEATVNNIRLWDAPPLLSTYRQIQSIRTYYTFYNVDVDRYLINGQVRQVMIAPRELEEARLPARTWVNTRLYFTHGYGMVMNPVHRFTPEGMPELFVQDIPPVSAVGVKIENPAIYYGETAPEQQNPTPETPEGFSRVTDTQDYVIVKTKNPEFDYPAGDQNKDTTYNGTGGVWMGSLFRRLLFAWGFRDMNILLTGSTTAESRIMFRRDIQERIRHIAPFLELDRDPYIVLSSGRLFWMQDAYTLSNRYPYSQPIAYKQKPINYIRNSVKIVVDAYSGNVDFYIIDQADPLIQTYRKIFPGLFKDFAEMPDDLKAHIRYPQDLFQIQMLLYNTYHMNDPKVFYNKEDLWAIPKEKYGNETVPVEPYYIQMRLPGEKSLEFILMMPLTPNNKDNMIAWLAARCDGEHYGELLVYKFPKEKLIYGPSQIEARIDQDTLISQQFSLWDQRGSSIIRGNLLIIPINDSILYVEPVYLKAEQRELPELKRVIVSYGGEVMMGLNLQETIEAVFGGKLGTVEQPLTEGAPVASGEQGKLQDEIQRITDHFTAARKHLSEGNWVKYGEEMDQVEKLIQSLQQQYGKQQ
jgi:uncharacterized membrane protein (UPF0182 family)